MSPHLQREFPGEIHHQRELRKALRDVMRRLPFRVGLVELGRRQQEIAANFTGAGLKTKMGAVTSEQHTCEKGKGDKTLRLITD